MTAKLSFRKWLTLEEAKKKIQSATESGEFPDKVFDCLSVALSQPANEKEAWENSVLSLSRVLKDTVPNQSLPLIKDAPTESGKPASWDYDGRGWFLWANMLCKAYGWTLEYVAELDFNDALALIQEILTDEQLEKEFYYGLSEVAYPFNKSTKKSIFKPMPRPYWMKAVSPPIKMQRYRADMLPQGMVIDTSGMPLNYNPLRDTVIVQKKTEETKPAPSP